MNIADGLSAAKGEPIMFWAPLPPPIGGVTRSAAALVDWLQVNDRCAGVVDVGQGVALPKAVRAHRKAATHLFWCSTPEAVAKYSVIARMVSGKKWIYIHGGQDETSYRVARLLGRSVYDRVFVTNSDLIDLLEPWKLGARAELASPFAPSGRAAPRQVRPMPEKMIVAIGGYRSWYGLDVAIDAFDALKTSKGVDAPSLTVVMYGPVDGPAPTDHLLEGRTDIRVERDLDPDQMVSIMREHHTLLRPSTVDGDALIIREALHAGLRVVASDVVPRPAGVEICPNTATAFADAIMSRGIVSTGAGLGPGFTELL
ncbi:MAG: glycosyltransferase involved in cell wall biosynthesis [Candidatus Poriferisodalaceae bacterium]|jgi:glycosyltransferase involved in cell wall biosynthesis